MKLEAEMNLYALQYSMKRTETIKSLDPDSRYKVG